MNILAFAVFDHSAERFNLPFFARSRAEACRNLAYQLQNDLTCLIATYPDNHSLYAIGAFDDASGTLECTGYPQHVCWVVDLLDPDKLKQLIAGGGPNA